MVVDLKLAGIMNHVIHNEIFSSKQKLLTQNYKHKYTY